MSARTSLQKSKWERRNSRIASRRIKKVKIRQRPNSHPKRSKPTETEPPVSPKAIKRV
jgi:hypothetical protein